LPYSEEPFPDDPLASRTPATAVEWEWGTILDPAHCVSDAIPRSETAPFPQEILRDLVTSEITSLHRRSNTPPRFSFDKLGRMIEETGGGTGGQSWSYDAEGRLTEHRNRNGSARLFRNSSWNLLAEETSPLGQKTAYTYSIRGEILTLKDPGGTVTEYRRDAKERITGVVRHGVLREQYQWDVADNLTGKLDGAGQPLVRFEAGKNGLVAARHLSSGETHQFKYDGNGRVVLAASGPDKTTFSYDKAGHRLEDKRNGRGVAHKFVNRQLAETMVLGRFSIRYHRPNARTLVVTDPLGGEHRFAWSPRGLIFRHLSNGTEEMARYGKDGRCLGKVTRHHAGRKKLWRRTYRYSAERELVEVHDSQSGVATYAYDANGRIVEESPPTGQRMAIQYDDAGNILRKSGLSEVSVAPGNRLQSAAGDTFTYNARQHVARMQGASGETSFDYDSRDMLVAARLRKGEWRATYDPLGRRVAKEWAAGKAEFYWDQDRLAAELLPDGRCRVYVYVDEHALVPFLFIDYENDKASPQKGDRYFILANQIGAPLRIENDDGLTVWSASYDAYGNATIDPSGTIEFNLRFPGHYHDAETGLHYNRHRYYSPKLGRYLQADPIGLAGGLNVYAYPANPLVQVDVNGLSCDGAPNKCKGDAEAPPKRTAAKKGDDLGKMADNAGMEKNHLENLSKRSQTNGEIIIVRGSNPASLPHHGKPGHVPKGVDCKLKTAKPPDPHAGLVKKPNPMSPDDAKHVKELEGKGWKFDEDGVAHDPNGNKVYGDHDLQGAYHKDEFGGTTSKVNTNDPNYQNGLNDDVCPENPMFQHGANDNFKKPDPDNPGKTKMGRTPEPDENYVVTKPDGSVTEINGTDELKKFYDEEGIPWPY
jgi:RHS repeat-associated protein